MVEHPRYPMLVRPPDGSKKVVVASQAEHDAKLAEWSGKPKVPNPLTVATPATVVSIIQAEVAKKRGWPKGKPRKPTTTNSPSDDGGDAA